MNNLEKFTRWFVIPISKLKEIPNGDGAFVALMIGCSLMERYYRIKSDTHHSKSRKEKGEIKKKDNIDYDDLFKVKAAEGLGTTPEIIRNFYSLFRNGLAHQGMPKKLKKGLGFVSYEFSHKYSAIPIAENRNGEICYLIDPWKFTDLIIRRYLEDVAVLEVKYDHAFAEIY